MVRKGQEKVQNSQNMVHEIQVRKLPEVVS